MKLWNKILKVLTFLRITEGGTLSLTNIALGVILYRIIFIKNLDLAHGIALLTCLMSYQGRRIISNYFPSQFDSNDSGTAGPIDNPDKR